MPIYECMRIIPIIRILNALLYFKNDGFLKAEAKTILNKRSNRQHASDKDEGKCYPKERLREFAAYMLAHDGTVRGNRDDKQNKRDGNDCIHNRRDDEGLHGINADKVDAETDKRRNRNDTVEPVRVTQLPVESLVPVKRLRYRVCRRTRQYRYRKQSKPDNTNGKNETGDETGVRERVTSGMTPSPHLQRLRCS